jgi:predicted membrane-bound spermidine synthase
VPRANPYPTHEIVIMTRILSLLFFCSGVSAIIYQIVWQRVLFASFGTDIESITIIVSVFMLGLGLGSLIGGAMSNASEKKLINYFIFFETSIGLFGLISIPLIEYISQATLHLTGGWWLPFIVFAILVIPTFAMGATLPVLVTYLFKQTKSVGNSVTRLYYINTLGSAIGCLVTVGILFVIGTRQSTIYAAALLNFLIALLTYIYSRKKPATV